MTKSGAKFMILYIFLMSVVSIAVSILSDVHLREEKENLITENKKLQKENEELNGQVKNYKWQIEQIPYICQYGGNNE